MNRSAAQRPQARGSASSRVSAPRQGKRKGGGARAPLRPLNRARLRQLKARAHALKPVVRLGQQGLTEAVVQELSRALRDHELVKVKLAAADKEARSAQAATLCQRVDAVLVQRIGHTASLYRANRDKPVIEFEP